MRNFVVDSSNELLHKLTEAALTSPDRVYSSGSSVNSAPVRSLGLISVEHRNPLNRFIDIEGRKTNIFGILGECIWVLAGSNVLGKWMTTMVPRALNFSDDGETWRAAYGNRLYAHGQFESVIQRLKRDPDSRQAMLSIYDPNLDSDKGIAWDNGSAFSRDHTCNVFLNFKIVNGHLDLYLTNRSNDIYWGLTNINLPEFTLIQEIVAAMLGVKVGRYFLISFDAHLYEIPVILNQADEVLKNYDSELALDFDTRDLELPDSIHNPATLKKFCTEIIDYSESCESNFDFSVYDQKINEILNKWKVKGKLADYVKLSCWYYCSKNGGIMYPTLKSIGSEYLERLIDRSSFNPAKSL